jgi:hypothetical protein
MDVTHHVEDVLQRTFPEYQYRIGPGDVIDASDASVSSAKTTLNWWKRQSHTADHANLLLFPYSQVEWPKYGGYGTINDNSAVMYIGNWGDVDEWGNIALHEVGHCLGAEHKHADVYDDTMTLMGNADRQRMNYFADDAIDVMRL